MQVFRYSLIFAGMSRIIHTMPFRSPYGDLLLGEFRGELCLCDWMHRPQRGILDRRVEHGLRAAFQAGQSDVLLEARAQLEAYFVGERKAFSLPMRTVGTPFQEKVWEQLKGIPYGELLSYAQLAEKLGDPTAVRAVAAANGANALSILIPCHRVIGSSGEMTGYAGGVATKQALLHLERGQPQGRLF